MEEILRLKNISLLYPAEKQEGFRALGNIDLAVSKGDFVCLLGPSGCGKSTLLNIIAGLLEPTTGTVEMYGKPITGTDPQRGMVFQVPALYPWLNTRDNVAFGLKMRGTDKKTIQTEVDKYLELVGLSEFGNSRIYELSGGMKQRAQLARVLINQPDLVLMDEPFGALDALTRGGMQVLTRKLWMQIKNTIILVTHDVDEALCMATRIVVLTHRPGQIAGEFSADFTHRIGSGEADCQFTPEYIALKKELMGIISAQ